VERDLWISKVKLATIKSVQSIGMLLQEIPMLEMHIEREQKQPTCCDRGGVAKDEGVQPAILHAAPFVDI
jgi:hypothetical protein